MHTVFAMMLQSKSAVVPPPVYADNASIWHHMSDALHQSIYRVLSLLIAILPGILAFFVALAIFTLIGMGISALLRRSLTWLKADERFARTRLASDWTPSSSPTEIVARSSFWGCVLLGLVIGVSAFDASYATSTPLPVSLLPYLTHAVGAILLLMAGVLIARFLARSVLISAVNAQLQYAQDPVAGSEMAGAGADGGDGSGSPRDRRRHRRGGVRDSVWRHCAHAVAGGGVGVARYRQPLAGEPRGARTRCGYADSARQWAGRDLPPFLIE